MHALSEGTSKHSKSIEGQKVCSLIDLRVGYTRLSQIRVCVSRHQPLVRGQSLSAVRQQLVCNEQHCR